MEGISYEDETIRGELASGRIPRYVEERDPLGGGGGRTPRYVDERDPLGGLTISCKEKFVNSEVEGKVSVRPRTKIVPDSHVEALNMYFLTLGDPNGVEP